MTEHRDGELFKQNLLRLGEESLRRYGSNIEALRQHYEDMARKRISDYEELCRQLEPEAREKISTQVIPLVDRLKTSGVYDEVLEWERKQNHGLTFRRSIARLIELDYPRSSYWRFDYDPKHGLKPFEHHFEFWKQMDAQERQEDVGLVEKIILDDIPYVYATFLSSTYTGIRVLYWNRGIWGTNWSLPSRSNYTVHLPLHELADEGKQLPFQELPTTYFIELSKQIESGIVERRVARKYAQSVGGAIATSESEEDEI